MDTSETGMIKLLKMANRFYVESGKYNGDVTEDARLRNALGQHPNAVIVTCADSRVIPEAIFSAGIGEMFVVRVAGNVIDETELASIEYAVEHLNAYCVVILGHTHCGAVHAALHGEFDGHVGHITRKIKQNIGDEQDEYEASKLNALAGAAFVRKSIPGQCLTVIAAVYDIVSGKVEFFD